MTRADAKLVRRGETIRDSRSGQVGVVVDFSYLLHPEMPVSRFTIRHGEHEVDVPIRCADRIGCSRTEGEGAA